MRLPLAFLLALTLAPAAAAQQRPEPRYHVAAAVGRTEYDLANAVAWTGIYGLRAGLALYPALTVEGQLAYMPVAEDDRGGGVLFPEAQLQLHWPGLPVSPYLGAGVGSALVHGNDTVTQSDAEATVSVAGGLRTHLPRSLLLLAEVRLRGIGIDFAAGTGDLSVGVGYRF